MATLLGAGVIFLPSMREWFAVSSWWGWGASLLLVLVLAALIVVLDRSKQDLKEALHRAEDLSSQFDKADRELAISQQRRAEAESQLGPLREQLEESRADAQRSRQQVAVTLDKNEALRLELADARTVVADSRQRIDEARGTIVSLEQRLAEPSARDREQFDSVLDDLPWAHGLLPWLQNSPLKQWTETQSEPVFSLEAKWAEWLFDSPPVHESFEALRSALNELGAWMATRAFPLNSSEAADFGWKAGDPMLYRIPGGDERVDGWGGHTADRQEGGRLAIEFLNARRAFERAGRGMGL